MVLDISGKDELNIVFSDIDSPKHILHLYSPRVDKYNIFRSFLSKKNTAYVSIENPSLIARQFNPKSKLTVIQPYQMATIRNHKKVLIDASPIASEHKLQGKYHGKKRTFIRQKKIIGISVLESRYIDMFERENYLKKNSKGKSILCAYDVSKLDSATLNKLVALHDKLVLSSPIEALKNDNLNSLQDFKSEKIEEFVKNELESIVLALTVQKPVCGQDIKQMIYKKFNIFLSSGTLYPLLHNLEKKGLLQTKFGFKTKTYTPVDREKIMQVLDEHVQVKNFLNGFLKAAVKGGVSEKLIECEGKKSSRKGRKRSNILILHSSAGNTG